MNQDNDYRRRILGLLIWPTVLLCTSYMFFDPVMGFVYRFTSPFLAPLLVAAVGTVYWVGQGGNTRFLRTVLKGLVLVTTLQLCSAVLPAYHWAHINSAETRSFHQRFGEVLNSISDTGKLVAFNDVGGPALFSGWDTLEGAGLVTPEVPFQNASKVDLVRSFNPDVIIESGCAATQSFPEHEKQGYRLLKPVPWIVYGDDGPKFYQCILGKTDYRALPELQEKLMQMGGPEIQTPWYLELFQWIKRIARQ